jgi:hypothetical protein
MRPNFVGNFVVICFMIVFYKGLKMERKNCSTLFFSKNIEKD